LQGSEEQDSVIEAPEKAQALKDIVKESQNSLKATTSKKLPKDDNF
tara:strand:+ start:480 stop:617 length:138 start_codon:yes stop_codon:yes gene_type:complete